MSSQRGTTRRRTAAAKAGDAGLHARSPVFHGLIRGMLPLFLLSLLKEGPRHGNDMMSRIAQVHGGWRPSAGSVYPVLRRFEEEGLIAGDWQRTSGAPKRVYRLTRKGRSALPKLRQRLIGELEAAKDVINAHLQMLVRPPDAGVSTANGNGGPRSVVRSGGVHGVDHGQ